MLIRYDVPKLEELIGNLYALTGISFSVLDTEYQTLAHCSEYGDFCSTLHQIENAEKNCGECDRRILEKCSQTGKLEHHICYAGLYDSAMPIVKNDTVVGYVLMGRVRSEKSPAAAPYFLNADADTQGRLKSLYTQLPVLTETQISALYALLPSILFNNAVRIVYDPLVTEIMEYIRDDLRKDLSVSHLCARFHVSANHLYNAFRDNLDRTVNDYITEQRLVRAKELLENTDDPVYMVAEKVGISNYTYFCRLFKKRCRCTPKEYRKSKER